MTTQPGETIPPYPKFFLSINTIADGSTIVSDGTKPDNNAFVTKIFFIFGLPTATINL